MKTSISGHTKALTLIGNPTKRSLSPAIHNASFQHLGIDAVYFANEVTADQLEAAVKGLKCFGYVGYNVTAPYKNAIIPYLDKISTTAAMIGSVNTVMHKDGLAVGYNTDALSFTDTLRQHGFFVTDKRIIIADIQAEGPAYAAQAAIEGAEHITILTNAEHVEEAKEHYDQLSQKTASVIEVYDIAKPNAFRHLVANAHVFCNATRIGSSPEAFRTPLDASLIHSNLLVVDSIYNPRQTRLLEDASMIGCETIGGVELLLNQVALAERLWFDCEFDREAVLPLIESEL
jgi:shikimate dehydrogenase